MRSLKARAKGFTLIELMVTVALAVILMAVGIPSFTTFMRNAELTSFTNTLLGAINAARGEAMKRGRYAMVVPNDGSSWDSGWTVFVDVDVSRTLTTGDITILKSEAKPAYLTITGNNAASGSTPYIMYDASGYTRPKPGDLPNLTIKIYRNDVIGTELLTQTRFLIIANTGRARICTPRSSSDNTCKTASAF